MSNKHNNPTISFQVFDAERKQIEARILASKMMKKDYFVRSCIYNRICAVGKKETIYPLLNATVIFDNVNDIVYLYQLVEKAPFTYVKLAMQENSLQNYVDAIKSLN